jgi:hypothetical protein
VPCRLQLLQRDRLHGGRGRTAPSIDRRRLLLLQLLLANAQVWEGAPQVWGGRA